ncbi:uncharacterized protein LOC111023285 [Momordica charantia]|uniref:Uncharacterized protein LOC111023285 n=1 Tax=Momordica charantia TaxID=3673 RepID=A0A6J1DUC1_MOMCH|nr:uncharacterized protein LOC111023285 [Momordica charantia]
MKLFRFSSVILFVLHTSLLVLYFSSNINASSNSDMAPNHRHLESNERLSASPLNRKLKLQDKQHSSPMRRNTHTGDVNLYDYRPVDPVPSSKRSIKHGPIEHGSPLIPYIPNPSPSPQHQPGGYV